MRKLAFVTPEGKLYEDLTVMQLVVAKILVASDYAEGLTEEEISERFPAMVEHCLDGGWFSAEELREQYIADQVDVLDAELAEELGGDS